MKRVFVNRATKGLLSFLFLTNLMVFCFLGSGVATAQTDEMLKGASEARTGSSITVSTKENFVSMLENPQTGVIYKLMQNIDMQGVALGVSADFSAEIDGQGFCVKNLSLTRSLFNNFNGKISNTCFENIVYENASTGSGVFARTNGGEILACSFSGKIVATQDGIGGLVGINSGTISGVASELHITSTGKNVGGICNQNLGTVTKTLVSATISGASYVGGIANKNEATISEVAFKGSIFGSTYVAGISVVNGEWCGIDNAYVWGNLSAEMNMGGVSVTNNGNIFNCFVNASLGGFSNPSFCASVSLGSGDISSCFVNNDKMPENIKMSSATYKSESELYGDNFMGEKWELRVAKNRVYMPILMAFSEFGLHTESTKVLVESNTFLETAPPSVKVEIVVDETTTIQEVEIGGLLSINSPEKYGYDFVGWSVSGQIVDLSSYTFNADTTLTAVFSPKTFTVNIVADEGFDIENLLVEGKYLQKVKIPFFLKTGYELASVQGCTIEGEELVVESLSADCVITITSKKIQYTVVLRGDGFSADKYEAKVEYGGKTSFSISPYENYILEQVSANAVYFNDLKKVEISNIQQDEVIFLKFREPKIFVVTFPLVVGGSIQDEQGVAVEGTNVDVVEGLVFKFKVVLETGYSHSLVAVFIADKELIADAGLYSTDTIRENLTVSVSPLAPNIFTVTVIDNEFERKHTMLGVFGEATVLSFPYSEMGYKIKGFYTTAGDDAEKIEILSADYSADVTVYVVWEKIILKLSFYDKTEQLAEMEVAYGEKFTAPTPVGNGKIFLGWKIGTTFFTTADGKAIYNWNFEENGVFQAGWSQMVLTQSEVVFNGNIQEMEFVRLDGFEYATTYEGMFGDSFAVNAGDYRCFTTVKFNNILVGEIQNEFKILPKKVLVHAQDIDITFGDSGQIVLKYNGLIGGVASLESVAKVDLPKDIGRFEVVPYGASGANYTFEYLPFVITINERTVENEDKTVIIIGATKEVEVNKVQVGSQLHKELSKSLSISDKNIDIYSFNSYEIDTPVKFMVRLKSNQTKEETRIFAFDNEGGKIEILDFEIQDGYAIFSHDKTAVFAVAQIEDGNYLFLVVGAVVVLIGVMVAVIIFKKKAVGKNVVQKNSKAKEQD